MELKLNWFSRVKVKKILRIYVLLHLGTFSNRDGYYKGAELVVGMEKPRFRMGFDTLPGSVLLAAK